MTRRGDLSLVPDVDRELDGLYARPLGEFTSARNDLAKRLKKAGQAVEAERVGALTKPSISAWAVNQLARREPDRVRELLDAGEELVGAQKDALAGKGADRFDDASRRQRESTRALVPAAATILAEAGHRPSDAVKERIASSLRAASVDPEGRRLLETGRLTEDFESAGLDLLAGFAPAAPRRAARHAPPRDHARARAAREKLEAARQEERRVSEAADNAEREADEAAARAHRLRADAARAAKAVDQAERALRRLEGR